MYFDPGKPWEGATVAILASGPSMSQAVADSVRHLPRIAVNRTSDLAPDADYIYAADPLFWAAHLHFEARPGIKVSMQQRMRIYPNVPAWVRVMQWGGMSGFDERPGYLRSGSNSGYQALHLAAGMGAQKVLLFGFDCHGGHWHGDHGAGLGNPLAGTYEGWIKSLNKLAPLLASRGVEVVNCSPDSRLECFNKLELAA